MEILLLLLMTGFGGGGGGGVASGSSEVPINIGRRRIALERTGMGVTLNGIAQGYITDRVTDILRVNGCDRTFGNMGCSEIRAVGRHADGRPWRVGLADPRQPDMFEQSV